MTPGSAPRSATESTEPVDRLRSAGVHTVRGSYVDSAGVLRAKQVPVDKAGALGSRGVGASSSWAVFAVDDEVAFTPSLGAVGDMRLRADLDALAIIDTGVAWVPFDLADQHGDSLAICPRGALRRQIARATEMEIELRAAIELEFTIVEAAAGGQPISGPAYGMSRLLDVSAFVADLQQSFQDAGIETEQIHAEYGDGQFEMSVAPRSLLRAVDDNVLARVLLGVVTRRHGLRVSFSPQPYPRGVGNGAHLHLSMCRAGQPLLSGGSGPAGLTEPGAAALAGLIFHLPESIGALAPSLLSGMRLQPGHWAGAFACWGVENREAAVRLCQATPANVHGANVEIKCVDPSANPYIAATVLLGLALDGVAARRELPPAVDRDPQQLSEEQRRAGSIVALAVAQKDALDAMAGSDVLRGILGAQLIEALVAVRRHEVEVAASLSETALVERFRYAWSA